MALVPCPECKKEISSISESCPHCGFPMKTYSSNRNLNFQPSLAPPSLPLDALKNKKIVRPFRLNDIFNITFWMIVAACLYIFLFKIYNGYLPSTQTTIEENYNTSTKNKSDNEEINYLKTTATKMINTYQNNEVKADEIYKNNYIEITGIVDSVDSDIYDEAVIHLASKNQYEFNTVMTNGNQDFQERASKVNKGQIITLRCIGAGEVIGSPVLNECKFK